MTLYDFTYPHARRGRKRAPRISVDEIQPRHREMIRLKAAGASNLDIADIFGVTPQCVSDALNGPLQKAQMKKLQAERDISSTELISNRIQELCPIAVDVLSNALMSQEMMEKDRARLALDLLKVAGHEAPRKLDINSTSVSLTILEQVKKQARAAGIVVDIEVENGEIQDAETLATS